jgi:hypothetical protein
MRSWHAMVLTHWRRATSDPTFISDSNDAHKLSQNRPPCHHYTLLSCVAGLCPALSCTFFFSHTCHLGRIQVAYMIYTGHIAHRPKVSFAEISLGVLSTTYCSQSLNLPGLRYISACSRLVATVLAAWCDSNRVQTALHSLPLHMQWPKVI